MMDNKEDNFPELEEVHLENMRDSSDIPVKRTNAEDLCMENIELLEVEIVPDENPAIETLDVETLDVKTPGDDMNEDVTIMEAAADHGDGEHDGGDDDFTKAAGAKSPLSVIKSIRLRFSDFSAGKYAMTAGLALVVIAVVTLTAATLSAWNKTKPAVLAPTEIAVHAATVLQTESEKKPMPLQRMKLEAVADESSITARVLGESGEALEGHDFVIKLFEGSLEENKEKVSSFLEKQRERSIKQSPQADAQTFSAKAADAPTQDGEATAYKDDDKNGEILIGDLAVGTYTLVVEAEAGFEVPDAAEATIIKNEVISNILDKVVEQNQDTQKEDPQAAKGKEEPAPPTQAASPAPTAPVIINTKRMMTLTYICKSGDDILYSLKKGDAILSYSDISSYIKDANLTTLHIQDGSAIAGYVYESSKCKVTDGEYDVVTKLLVETQAATTATTMATTTASSSANAAATVETNKASQPVETQPFASTQAADKVQQPASTQAPTFAQPQKKYQVMEVSVVTRQETREVFDGWYADESGTYFLSNGSAFTGWHRINGRNYYFNPKGILCSTLVIDVSTYNGDINWQKVKASGINDVIIRVGYRGWWYGKIVRDKRFNQNVQGAKAAGLNVGAYFVTQAVNTAEAVEEASFIVAEARLNNLNLPLAIDVEWGGDWDAGEQGRGNYISAGERTAIINAFCQTVNNAGYTPMVYSNKDWLMRYIHSSEIVPYAKIWVAQYSNIDETEYDGRYDMWQFSAYTTVDGINGNVDMSARLE